MPPARLDDRDLLARLVGFDTVSAKSNLALIGWVADYLDQLGVKVRLTHDAGRTKANLFATIGPEKPGGVILSGHTDVVPVDGQDWHSDPFTLTQHGDRLHGRGAVDMKAFIALALARVPLFQAAAQRVPVHLALSFDEEVGCLGVYHLIEDLGRDPWRPALALIGEPTGMQVANAHKGIWLFTTVVTGLEGHSSMPHRGVNAIAAAAEIIGEILRLAEDCRRRADPASPFDPPYTSFNIGEIHGGTAANIIARDCRFVWEFRPAPGDDPAALLARIQGYIDEELLPRLRRVHDGVRITTRREVAVPSLAPEPNGAAEALARLLAGRAATTTISFGTEAGLFQQAGLSAIVCGPGSIDQAHRPDEYIDLGQLAEGGRFIDALARWVAVPG